MEQALPIEIATPRRRLPPMPYTWVQWINWCVGGAVAITPFVEHAGLDIRLGGIVTGGSIAIISMLSFFFSKNRWGALISLLNIIAGFWLIVASGFILDSMMRWQSVIFGVLAIVTAMIVVGLHELHLDLTSSS
jgi:hypothetical protein